MLQIKNKPKFNVTFIDELENIEEELNKLGLEDTDELEDTIEKKDYIIQIKLLQSMTDI